MDTTPQTHAPLAPERGRAVIVTGGGRGLGWEMADALVHAGHRVLVTGARAADEPMDVAESAIQAAADDLLHAEAERGRLAVLQQGWHTNAPTWIQSAAQVNLGDFPTFDRTVERAENDLRTLEWVIDQQRRQASGRPASAETEEAAQAHWLRRLLPAEWIALLKQNREWVAAGGGDRRADGAGERCDQCRTQYGDPHEDQRGATADGERPIRR